LTTQSIREQLISEMRAEGFLLPEYDWNNQEFMDTLKDITLDWFARHPETIRGTGEFQAKYPGKVAALDLLWKMAQMGRITPDEYIALYKEINNF
jgi:hypothetical protein